MTSIDDAYDRFARKRFPHPSDAQLTELERNINVTLPADYRRFVLDFNGGYFTDPAIQPVGEVCPRETLNCLFGIGAAHPTAELGRPEDLALFDDNDPPEIVPIGSTGMGGLIILLTHPEGRGAIFLKQAFGGFYYLSEGIEGFFDLLRDTPADVTT